MLNEIYITNGKIESIVTSAGESPNISVYFADEEYTADKKLDLYYGEMYHNKLALLPTSAGLKVSFAPTNINGRTINFRLFDGENYGDFYHISLDMNKEFSLAKYNDVTCGNRYTTVTPKQYESGQNTYETLGKYTHRQLSGFTTNELRNDAL